MKLVHHMRRLGHVGVTVALATFIACAYHMPTSPTTSTDTTPNTTPTSIRVTTSSRTDQKIDVTATVLSGDGHLLGNIALAFSVDAGTISPNVAVTDANGSARATASTPSATTLHVTGAGLSSQLSLPASTAPATPDSVILNVPGTGTEGVPVTMFVSSAASGTWSWTFGDGAGTQTTSLSTTHTYSRPGGFTVTVAGPNGTTSSGNITIAEAPAPVPVPTPATSVTVECTPGDTTTTKTGCHVTLTGADGSIITSTISSIDWDWGDGNQPEKQVTVPPGGTAAVAVATHQYTVSGTYTVGARVHAASGDFNGQTTVKIP
jgi:hypothetical protein